MHGPELGVQADDIDAPEMDQEPKQEVLENKDVRFILCQIVNETYSDYHCHIAIPIFTL